MGSDPGWFGPRALLRRPLALSLSKGVLAVAPTAATLVYEWTTGVMPANWVRAAAGVCLGAVCAALIEREVN